MRIVKGNEFRLRSLYGLSQLDDVVGSTLGINGGNVIFSVTNNIYTITKDGVTVAENFSITMDDVANACSLVASQAARQVNNRVGDSTTSSTVLCKSLYETSLKLIGEYPIAIDFKNTLPSRLLSPNAGGYIPFDYDSYSEFMRNLKPNNYSTRMTARDVRDFIDSLMEDSEKFLMSLRDSTNLSPEEIVRTVSHTSSNGDERIKNLFIEAFKSVNMEGVVIAEASTLSDDKVTTVDGYVLNSEPLHHGFLNQNTQSLEMDNPLIIVSDEYIANNTDAAKIRSIYDGQKRPLLVICGHMDDSYVNHLGKRFVQAGVPGCIVKAPSFGEERLELLYDVASLTGATMVDGGHLSFGDLQAKHCGTCKKVIISSSDVKIMPDYDNEDIVKSSSDRLNVLISRKENEEMIPLEREKLSQRISNMRGRFARITVSVDSETEAQEVGARLTDALCAISTALKSGVVPGGGASLLLLYKHLITLPSYKGLEQALYDFLSSPICKLMYNSGYASKNVEVNVRKIINDTSVDNPLAIELRSQRITNMIDAGIVDPVEAPIEALKCAASVAKTLVQTRSIMANE